MILQAELDEIEKTLLKIDQVGLRKVCAFCDADLPGSDIFGQHLRHGVCSPRCAQARALGWEDETESGEIIANDQPWRGSAA